MIFTLLAQIASNLFAGLLNVADFINIPLDFMAVIATFTEFGNWIIGADLMLIFFGCVVAWYGVKLTIGIVLFIWRLLPLT